MEANNQHIENIKPVGITDIQEVHEEPEIRELYVDPTPAMDRARAESSFSLTSAFNGFPVQTPVSSHNTYSHLPAKLEKDSGLPASIQAEE